MFKVSALTLILSTVLLSLSASAESHIDLVFAEFRFQIPEQPEAIGVQDDETFLAVRYGTEPGRNYLTFTNQPVVPTNGCPPEEFFSRAMEVEPDAETAESCDASDIQDFRVSFLEGSDSGMWSGQDVQGFYMLRKEKSMVYLVGPNDSYIKIDTDFMAPEELKLLVEKANLL